MAAILTAADVRRIRRTMAVDSSASFAALGRELGVHPETVAHAAYGRTWRKIGRPQPVPKPEATGRVPAIRKLTRRKVANARRAYSDGESMASIAARYGVAESTIHKAVHGLSWAGLTDPPAVPFGPAGRRGVQDRRAQMIQMWRDGQRAQRSPRR